MFRKKTIHDYDIAGKTVLVRADYNVPLTHDGHVSSNFRIRQNIPTIRVLQEKGCKIIICSHLGRPKSRDDRQFSLKPGRKRAK
jgi:phosphoglycerate kinase